MDSLQVNMANKLVDCLCLCWFFSFLVTKQSLDQYILNTAPMSWNIAHEYCRTRYTELANMRNSTEFQIIDQIANGEEVWFGYVRDDWVWSDQNWPAFRYWPADQYIWSAPSQGCGALLKNESGRWGALPCTESHPFLCRCGEQKNRHTHKHIKLMALHITKNPCLSVLMQNTKVPKWRSLKSGLVQTQRST